MGMSKGNTGKVLYINLSALNHRVSEISPDVYSQFVGGKGLATWLLQQEIQGKTPVDPLGEDTPVIFAAGPLTGTDAPAMRGVCVSLSPLTGGYVDSYYGGHLAQEIKYAGFDAVVIQGKADKPTIIFIEDEEVSFLSADQYWGLDSLAANHEIKKDQEDDSLKLATIGQAGENKVPFSLVSCEYNRHAGRAGIGAVMGSKYLKAMALKGTQLVGVADQERFDRAVETAKNELKASDSVEELTSSGTAATLWFSHSEGLLPVHNYQKGTFNPQGLAHGAQQEKIWLRDVGCASCPIRCSKVGVIREGKRQGTVSDIVEYETAALMGANLGLSDINEVAYLLYLCDTLGMDGMSAGSIIGFAMECFERGILTPEAYDGISLSFGSKENIAEVLTMIAHREGKLGQLLAQGTKEAARSLGEDAEAIASHVKGLDIPAFGPRGVPGVGLAYMTADRGACHQRALPVDYEVGNEPFNGKVFDRLAVHGKAEIVVNDQNYLAALDSFVKCDFGTFGISEKTYMELFTACTGETMDKDWLYTLGERIWNLNRLINLNQGISYKDEKLPRRFYEPLPDGPAAGHKFTKEDEKIMLAEYYAHRGWDQYGRPKEEKLEALGLLPLFTASNTKDS